jgi:hypothetical protein
MRSLPFPRRLQLVKLLRAHGLRDVERLREDELKEALARLSILMPDLTAETPFVQPAPSSQLHGAATDAPAPGDDDEDRYMVPRFREPRVFLPNNERTFLRAIAVKPRVLFATWDTRWDLPDGPARVEVYARDFLGDAPSADQILQTPPRFSVGVDRTAPGWYIDVPAERLAIVLRLVIDTHDGDQVAVATSNITLTPPARPAPPGPLWMATLTSGVDRRALRGAGLLKPQLPDGASVLARGEALPESVLTNASVVADPPSSSFRFLGHTGEEPPSSSSKAAKSSSPSSSSVQAAARVEVRP